jgi:hypothetical protein
MSRLKHTKVHHTKKFDRYRQFPPSECDAESFRVKKVSPSTELILCKKKGSSKQSVQSELKRHKR